MSKADHLPAIVVRGTPRTSSAICGDASSAARAGRAIRLETPPGCSTTSTCATIPQVAIEDLWYHAIGCRSWLVVTRDTVTHEVFGVDVCHDDARAGQRMTGSPSCRQEAWSTVPSRCDFTFDGKAVNGFGRRYAGFRADGQRQACWSAARFKYHRPRGVVTAGPAEPNALVRTADRRARREPNTRATVAELYDGLGARQPEPLAVAEVRFGRDQLAGVAVPRRRFLLQDLHVAGASSGKSCMNR